MATAPPENRLASRVKDAVLKSKAGSGTGGGKKDDQPGSRSYTEEEVQRIRADYEKKMLKLKKAAEVQMRNVKMMAKERARRLLDETL
jgi:hypothetical protein